MDNNETSYEAQGSACGELTTILHGHDATWITGCERMSNRGGITTASDEADAEESDDEDDEDEDEDDDEFDEDDGDEDADGDDDGAEEEEPQ